MVNRYRCSSSFQARPKSAFISYAGVHEAPVGNDCDHASILSDLQSTVFDLLVAFTEL